MLVGTPGSKTLRSLCVFGRCSEFYERYKSQCQYAQYVQIRQCRNIKEMTGVLCSRAAEIFGGFCRQTPPLSFTQNVAAYQFLGLQNFNLPRPESLEVGNFKGNMQIKWPTPKLSGRGKTMTQGPKNWYAVTFWVKLNGGVCLPNPQKISAAMQSQKLITINL